MAPDKTGLRGKAFHKRRATPPPPSPVTAGRKSLEERSDNDEYDENSASEHDEDSENQSIVNSLPSTHASGAAEANSTSQQTEQPRLKRSRSATQIQPKHMQRSTKVEGAKPKRVIRDSEAKTALTNRLIALTSELDSKRGRISDLRDEKQQLIDGGIATDNRYPLTMKNLRLHDENVNLLEPALLRQQAGYQAPSADTLVAPSTRHGV
ncbi:hypothetical protein AM587_10003957 [Phytophthora nicotianae]|uniref:Uncharacterized protein n=1 Tax=Phytophthora nicotianae TaxID=4792 RepID=A0A0W8D600_PHYNI|nr:hypothetical protein AM587_10003957 [Phytophthora nicotianae]